MESIENSDVVSIIFQPNPSRDVVIYWLNAEKRRRRSKRDDFTNLVRKIQPSVLSPILQACNTYSFYLWDAVDGVVKKLVNKSSDREVLNPLRDYLNSVLTGIEPKSDQDSERKPKSLEEYLAGFGFESPNDNSVKNLDVKLRAEASAVPKRKSIFARGRK